MRTSWLGRFGPFIVLAYGALIIYYYWTDLLAFLVNPFYNKFILAGGLILLFLGLFWLLWDHSYKTTGCEKSQKSQLFSILLLMIPLILGIFFKPQLLSSASAVLRGVSSDLAAAQFDPTVFSKPSEERSLIEWIRILNVDPEPDHYKGQPVLVQGSIIMDEKFPPNLFQIGQFVLTCCAADARVIALPVQFNPNVYEPQKDQWVELKGKMSEGILEGHRQVIIEFESAKNIPTPNDAYQILQ